LERHFLLISKPKGITSRKFLNKVQDAIGTEKVGHAGTLDPMASGLLFIGIGKATKLIQYVNLEPKEYVVQIQFGIETDTNDITGKVLRNCRKPVTLYEFMNVIQGFKGKFFQMPPLFSAKKVSGIEAYKYARKGEAINKLKPVEVEIYDIEVKSFLENTAVLRILCSKGTYMRALARDIGIRLQSCAVISGITRTRLGRFTISDATTLTEIERGNFLRGFFSVDDVLDFSTVLLKNKAPFLNGNEIILERLIVKDKEGRLLGVGKVEQNSLKPEKVIYEDI